MVQIKDSLEQIQQYAANPLGNDRVIDKIEIDHWARQGDVYITKISDSVNLADYAKTADRQLAPGSSKGSRHTVDETVEVWKAKTEQKVDNKNNGYTMLGPVIVSKDRFSILHPDHAHFSLPKGSYQVSYQIDPSTLSRVLD